MRNKIKFYPKGKDPEAERDAFDIGYQYGWDDAHNPAPVSGWMPIETAPRDGQKFAAIACDGEPFLCMFLEEAPGGWINAGKKDFGGLYFPTCWQPLPTSSEKGE